MVVLISGASHTGKTALAARLMKKYGIPYFSIDHLKMGLIRSGNTKLTPLSDDSALTAYLWPIVCEMVKTAIENKQDLIVEGCYIPFDWKRCFEKEYLEEIRHLCLVMSEDYINKHFDDITAFANVIEQRLCDDFTKTDALHDNKAVIEGCKKHGTDYILIDGEYKVDIELATNGNDRECACCRLFKLPNGSLHEICPICGWEDDEVQNDDPDFEGGANDLSLNQYKKMKGYVG